MLSPIQTFLRDPHELHGWPCPQAWGYSAGESVGPRVSLPPGCSSNILLTSF